MSIFLTSPVTFHLLMYGLLFNNIFKLCQIKRGKKFREKGSKIQMFIYSRSADFFSAKIVVLFLQGQQNIKLKYILG